MTAHHHAPCYCSMCMQQKSELESSGWVVTAPAEAHRHELEELAWCRNTLQHRAELKQRFDPDCGLCAHRMGQFVEAYQLGAASSDVSAARPRTVGDADDCCNGCKTFTWCKKRGQCLAELDADEEPALTDALAFAEMERDNWRKIAEDASRLLEERWVETHRLEAQVKDFASAIWEVEQLQRHYVAVLYPSGQIVTSNQQCAVVLGDVLTILRRAEKEPK